MKNDKKNIASQKSIINVKKLINHAKVKGLVKPHTEAFKENPVELEEHKGKKNYFYN